MTGLFAVSSIHSWHKTRCKSISTVDWGWKCLPVLQWWRFDVEQGNPPRLLPDSNVSGKNRSASTTRRPDNNTFPQINGKKKIKQPIALKKIQTMFYTWNYLLKYETLIDNMENNVHASSMKSDLSSWQKVGKNTYFLLIQVHKSWAKVRKHTHARTYTSTHHSSSRRIQT